MDHPYYLFINWIIANVSSKISKIGPKCWPISPRPENQKQNQPANTKFKHLNYFEDKTQQIKTENKNKK